MQQTKYFIEGVQAAHAGYVRACRYKRLENILEFKAGYDSVSRSHQVVKYASNPKGKTLSSYIELPDVVYIGNLQQCLDRVLTLSQADRVSFFAVYDADGKPYNYQSSISEK